MERLILFLSLICSLILLVFGLLNPSNPVMWLASTSINFAFARLIMIGVLGTLLITHPPRHMIIRVFIGLIALFIGLWSLSATYQNKMKFLDTMSLTTFAISTGIVVLERDYQRSRKDLDVGRKAIYLASLGVN